MRLRANDLVSRSSSARAFSPTSALLCLGAFPGRSLRARDAVRAAAQGIRPVHPYPLLLGAACAGHLGDMETGATLVRELKAILPSISVTWVEATSPYVHAEDRARLIEGRSRCGLD